MLNTDAEVKTLYVLECTGGHRIVRETSWELNKAVCSLCRNRFIQLAAIEREPGETDVQCAMRAMKWRPKR